MKKILILNFTRIGDLIQTSPLLAGLKERYPGCHITLAANVSFGGICRNLPHIDRLVLFDPKQFIHADQGQTSIMDVWLYLDSFVEELRAGKFDILVNLSHSNLSAVMGRLLKVPEVRGIVSDDQGNKLINDPWLAYFSSLLAFRHYNTFNLVDLYQLGGGVSPKGRGLLVNTAEPEALARPLLMECGIQDDERVIAVQAGASMKERRWPAKNFAKAAGILSRKWNAKVVLLGAGSEKELVDEVAAAMEVPHLNLAGRTTLEQLIGVVKRSAVLITNDTATMHIAAAAGTPIVALFVVHAYGFETGPYCERAVIMEPELPCYPCLHSSTCPHYACLDYITPEMVAEAADLSRDGVLAVSADSFPRVRLMAPYFAGSGFYDLRPMKKVMPRESDILGRIYRSYFMQPLDGGIKEDWRSYLKANYLEPAPAELADWGAKKLAIYRKLSEIAKEGEAVAIEALRDLKGGKVDRIKSKAGRFLEIDRNIEIAASAHPETMPIVKLFIVGKGNIGDKPINVILENTRVLYSGISAACGYLSKCIQELMP